MIVYLASAVLIGLLVAQVANLFTTVYFHRCLSHRAFSMKPQAALFFRSFLWLSTGLKAREWVAVHRKHHAFTDVEGDPHSPILLGTMRVQLTNAALYRRVARDGVTVARYSKDLPPDRLDRALFDNAFLGLGIGIAFLWLGAWWMTGSLLEGLVYGYVAAVVHTAAYLMMSGAVNASGHVYGMRPFPNNATNQRWLALLTAGEGWHNNHHALPTSARLGVGKGETDFGWWTICALRWMRLATVRQLRNPIDSIAA